MPNRIHTGRQAPLDCVLLQIVLVAVLLDLHLSELLLIPIQLFPTHIDTVVEAVQADLLLADRHLFVNGVDCGVQGCPTYNVESLHPFSSEFVDCHLTGS